MCGAMKTRLVTSPLETSSPTAPGSFQSVPKNILLPRTFVLLLVLSGPHGGGFVKVANLCVTLCLNLNLA